jgi:hypothetical protein
VPDAPSDGSVYGRLNAAWSKVLALVGGTLTGPLTLAADPVAALQAATKQYVDNTAVSMTGDTPTGVINLKGTVAADNAAAGVV